MTARVRALDCARGLGVIAMVVGHTLDALLSPAARAQPGVVEYWKARGFTAPLFLLVAGWAAALAARPSGRRGVAAVRARLPRVLLLLGIGYALHLPAWDLPGLLAGSPASWRPFLEFDALHTIGLGVLVVVIVLALPWRDPRVAAAALLALAASAVALAGRGVPAPPRHLVALALHQALGGSSLFPLLPWIAYLLLGAAVGVLLTRQTAPRMFALAGAGLALVAASALPGGLVDATWSLVLLRTGVVLVVVSALSALPEACAALLRPLGRASLSVYTVHLIIVYGWGGVDGLAAWIGPKLGVAAACGAAVLVLGASIGIRAVLRTCAASATEALRAWGRERALDAAGGPG